MGLKDRVVKLEGRDLEDFETVKTWFNSLKTKSQHTRMTYLGTFKRFCEWAGRNPDQLIEERRERILANALDRTDENRLESFYRELLDKGYRHGTAVSHFTSAQSFYKHNGVKLNIIKFPVVESHEEFGVKRLKKDEIQKMLGYGDKLRDKLVVLIGGESGLRSGALRVLTFEMFVDLDYERKVVRQVPCRIELPKRFYFGRKKEGITFVCEDAVDMIFESWDRRVSWGEPISMKSPVFPTYRATIKFEGGPRKRVYLKRYWPVGSVLKRVMDTTTGPGRKTIYITENANVEEIEVLHLSQEGIVRTMEKLRKRAQIEYDPEKEAPVSIHSLRKYLHSTLDVCGVNTTLVNVILGHSNAIQDHYSGRKHLDIEEIRHAYRSAMHGITITETAVTRGKIEELEKGLEEKTRIIEALMENSRRKEREMETLRKEIADLKPLISFIKELKEGREKA